jgi:hypothetical protein
MNVNRDEYYRSIFRTEYNPYSEKIIPFSRRAELTKIFPTLDFVSNGQIICGSNRRNLCKFWIYEVPDEYFCLNSKNGCYVCDQFDGLKKCITEKIC